MEVSLVMGPARERSHGDTYDGLVPANEQDQPEVPKKIWFLWLQGLDGSPAVVRQCRNSWLRMNPTWEFHLLSRDNLGDYTDIDVGALDHIGMSQVADLVRLDLLQKYGGVWADATCFCIRELDSWLPEYTQSGFFAFEKPGRDRAIASWFLAEEPALGAFTVLWQYESLERGEGGSSRHPSAFVECKPVDNETMVLLRHSERDARISVLCASLHVRRNNPDGQSICGDLGGDPKTQCKHSAQTAGCRTV
jgi:hypothetical protein